MYNFLEENNEPKEKEFKSIIGISKKFLGNRCEAHVNNAAIEEIVGQTSTNRSKSALGTFNSHVHH